MTVARIKALDLFAGTGWGVACRRLGIKESGVEIMPEAVATRTANGMETIYHDVWDGIQLTAEQHRAAYGSYGLLIASPPCQTFSLAGKGAGRAALDEVLEAIELHAYKDAAALLAFGEQHDMRTALVLTPLAYVWRDRPRLVAMEQVPTVLPVWEACAEVMREWGYEVKVEVLNAEQYGVPQTRKRAILVARRGGPVAMPTPTHSRYYSRTPHKLDPGVKKWVSMAEALGWHRPDPEGVVFCPTNLRPNAGFRTADRPASSLAFGHDNPRWITPEELDEYRETGAPNPGVKLTADEAAALQSYPTWAFVRPSTTVMGDPRIAPAGHHDNHMKGAYRATVEEAAALQSYPTGRGLIDRPAPTITGGGTDAGGAEPIAKFHERYTSAPGWVGGTERLTVEEAAALQSYPTHLAASGTSCQVVDPRPVTAPAPTITGSGTAEWGTRPTRAAGPGDRDPEGVRVAVEEAAALQSYPTAGWGFTDRPAMTVTGHGLVTRSPTGQKQAVLTAAEQGEFIFRPPFTAETAAQDDYVAREDGYLALSDMYHPDAVNCTPEENAVLQSYEPPFVFCGTKTKQFLQIGNAVPPLLAEHILAALIGIPVASVLQAA